MAGLADKENLRPPKKGWGHDKAHVYGVGGQVVHGKR